MQGNSGMSAQKNFHDNQIHQKTDTTIKKKITEFKTYWKN